MDLAPALDHLAAGEVIGVPTDTVYGIAADPYSATAVGKLFTIKGRWLGKPIGLLAAGIEQAAEVVDLSEYAVDLARQHWPGPLNLVGRPLVDVLVGTLDSLAVRVPNHETALELLRSFGALAVTSANLAGGPESTSDVEARALLGDAVALYLPGTCRGGTASTTVDVRGSAPIILRPGPIDLSP